MQVNPGQHPKALCTGSPSTGEPCLMHKANNCCQLRHKAQAVSYPRTRVHRRNDGQLGTRAMQSAQVKGPPYQSHQGSQGITRATSPPHQPPLLPPSSHGFSLSRSDTSEPQKKEERRGLHDAQFSAQFMYKVQHCAKIDTNTYENT